MAGLYELKDKLNRCKKKRKEDASEFQYIIKDKNKTIEILKEQIKYLKEEEMYQTWLKEREKIIEQVRENSKLLDENNDLRKGLIKKENTIIAISKIGYGGE